LSTCACFLSACLYTAVYCQSLIVYYLCVFMQLCVVNLWLYVVFVFLYICVLSIFDCLLSVFLSCLYVFDTVVNCEPLTACCLCVFVTFICMSCNAIFILHSISLLLIINLNQSNVLLTSQDKRHRYMICISTLLLSLCQCY